MTLAEATKVGGPAEVTFDGTVTSGPRFARTTSGVHERFAVHSDDGIDVEIVDNVSIAPRCPVHAGDRIEVKGEFAHAYADGSPIVHWTHHDPSGTHVGGFLEVGGHLYA